MEAPDQSRHEPDAVHASIEIIPHRSIHLSRRRNSLASPLLRLPTELILKIFAHGIELDGDDGDDDDNSDNSDGNGHNVHGQSLLVLTAVCHQLREIGIASPQLWGTVDLTTPLVAELFLGRCKYDPHTLIKSTSASESRLLYPVKNPRRDALWRKLKGRTFNGLRSIVFKGSQRSFALTVAGVLQRAPMVSNLDLCNYWARPGQELPWPVGDPIPLLSSLRLSKFLISWTSPLLRNLTQLVLDFLPASIHSERTSIETFLTALANCPDLETLSLTHAGPDLLNGHQDNCDTVVQLRKLQEFFLEFRDSSRVGYILSHIGFPELTKLAVHVPIEINDMPGTVSRVLPRQNAQTAQRFRKSTALTVYLGPDPHFFIDNLLIRFQESNLQFFRSPRDPQVLTRFASKIVEVIGGDTIISLNVETQGNGAPDGMWGALLHGLPHLERICYHHIEEDGDGPLVNSFVLVFSGLFGGSPVCPRLQRLELPKGVLTQDASVTALKCALTERDACGRRLKWIGLSGDATEADDRLILEPFRGLVDEVE